MTLPAAPQTCLRAQRTGRISLSHNMARGYRGVLARSTLLRSGNTPAEDADVRLFAGDYGATLAPKSCTLRLSVLSAASSVAITTFVLPG